MGCQAKFYFILADDLFYEAVAALGDPQVRTPHLDELVGRGLTFTRAIYLQDVMPTTLELADVACPEQVEFRSLMPLIRGQRSTNYDAIYGAYLHLQRMVTMDGFKLIFYPQARCVRLYHVARDPDEMLDLADDAKYRPVIRRF
jgi:choline-sulfatase